MELVIVVPTSEEKRQLMKEGDSLQEVLRNAVQEALNKQFGRGHYWVLSPTRLDEQTKLVENDRVTDLTPAQIKSGLIVMLTE